MVLLLLACAAPPVGPVDPGAGDSVRDTAADPADTADTGVEPAPLALLALEGHPRLVARPEDREVVRARLAGTVGSAEAVAAWQGLHAEAVRSCDAGAPAPTADPLDPGATWNLAAVARACALLAWLDEDPARAARAAELLAQLPPDAHALADAADDVHLSTALALAVQAWDLLAGVEPAADRAPVLALLRSTWARYVVEEPLWHAVWRNNHNVKFAAAFGLAALAFSDEPEATAWAGYAQTELDRLIDELAAADGGWGEGPYYQMYASFQLLPYLRAWHRLFPGQVERHWTSCAHHLGDCTPTPVAVGDLWTDERYRRTFAWNLAVRRPDGLRPPVDDGLAVGFPSGLLAGEDPAYGGDWLQTRFATWAGDLTADLLVGFDGSAAEPPPACVVRPDSGHTTLQAGATWALLLAEPPGVMQAGGHEHDDAGAISVYLAGREVVLDPGYAGWSDRDATDDYALHAGLLVDGEGPDDPSLTWDTPAGCAGRVTLGWDGRSWTRTVAVAEGGVVVHDAVSVPGELRFPLRSGEGTGTLEPTTWGARVRWADATVIVATTDPAGRTSGVYAPAYGTTAAHDTLTVATDGDTLTVLVAGPPDWDPAVTVTDDRVTVDGVGWAAPEG